VSNNFAARKVDEFYAITVCVKIPPTLDINGQDNGKNFAKK
jgi:hypothetical protein